MLELTYRETLERPLTSLEVDGNFRSISNAIATLGDPDGGIEEAPADGQTYGRKDAVWTVVVSGISDAPNNGEKYVRVSGGWSLLSTEAGIEDAPLDGNPYNRMDGQWVAAASGGGGGGIEEAPDDGQTYGRTMGAWAPITSGGSGGSPSRLSVTAWSSTTDYVKGDIVEAVNGNVWLAVSPHTNHTPDVASGYWLPLSLGGGDLTYPVTQTLYHDNAGSLTTVASLLTNILGRLQALEGG